MPVGERCELCGAPVGEEHPHLVDMAKRALLAPAGRARCCLTTRTRSGRTRRCRTATAPPGRCACACGRTCRSRWTSPSSSATRARPGGRASTRARPARPSPSCRSTPGTSSSPRTRRWRRWSPTSRRCSCGCARRPGRGATSCRSTPATSWSASCAGCGAGSTAAGRRTSALDAFFDGVRARSRRVDRVTDARLRGPRRARRAVRRGRRRCSFRLRITEPTGDAVHAVALRVPDPDRAAAPRATPSRGGTRLVELFGEPRAGATRCGRSCGPTSRTMVPGFTGSTEVDLPVTCTYDFEVAAAKYLHALTTARSRSCCCSAARCSPAATAGFAVEPGARGTRRRRYRLPVAVWRRADGPLLPEQRLAPAATATRSTRCTRFKAARGAADAGSDGLRGAARNGSREARAVTASRRSRRRAGRRRRAVRGLRALPVPRLGGEEPAALAVRRAVAARRRGRRGSARQSAMQHRVLVRARRTTAELARPLPAGAVAHGRARPRPVGFVPVDELASATPTGCRWDEAVEQGASSGRRAATGRRARCRRRTPRRCADPDGRHGRPARPDALAGRGRAHASPAAAGRRRVPADASALREHRRLGRRPSPAATALPGASLVGDAPAARRDRRRSCRCIDPPDGAAAAVAALPQRPVLAGAGRRPGRRRAGPRRSSCTTIRRSRRRAPATCSTRPRSTRSSPCGS